MKNKEEAKAHYIEIVKKSWTYGRMTYKEKERCLTIFSDDIQGNYEQRLTAYANIYSAFLIGLGYDGFNWRD